MIYNRALSDTELAEVARCLKNKILFKLSLNFLSRVPDLGYGV